MSREKTPLGPALRAMAARERGSLGAHPSLDQWAAYQEGKVGAEEAERLRDHLARCPECAQLVMEWMSFSGPVPPEGARPIPKGEIEVAWKKLRSQIQFPAGEAEKAAMAPANPVGAPAPAEEIAARGGLSAIPGGRQTAPPVTAAPRRRIPSWLPQTLAAVFFLTSVGLGLQVAKMRSVAPEGQAGLQIGDRIVNLSPLGDAERSRGPAEPKTLFWDKSYELILTPTETVDFPSFRCLVVEADRPETIEFQEEIEPDEDGYFTLRIPKGTLSPGTYRALLNGIQDGRSVPIDQFEFKVEKR